MSLPKNGPVGPTDDISVAVTRTYLTMASLQQLHPAPASGETAARHNLRLEPITPCPVPTWRRLYRDVGSVWHWHDRDTWDDARLQDHLGRADTHIHRISNNTAAAEAMDAGMLELASHADGSVEIVYLGFAPAWIGQGCGGWLIESAVRCAFALGASRVWLHTCTLDAPAALPNYLARGFTVERTETYHVVRSSL